MSEETVSTPSDETTVKTPAVKPPKASKPKADKPKKAAKKPADKPAKKSAKKKPAKAVKAERKPREKKSGLRRHQLRALKAISSYSRPITVAEISAKAGISSALISAGLGRLDKDARIAFEEMCGYKSLISQKFVMAEEHENIVTYSITAAGKVAMKETLNGSGLPDVNPGPTHAVKKSTKKSKKAAAA